VRLLSAKESQDEVTVVAEIAVPLPTKCGEIAKYLEGILGRRVEVMAKDNSQSKNGVNTKRA
jgi:hypothetical protein